MRFPQKEPLKELANFSYHWAPLFCNKDCVEYHKHWSAARLVSSGGKFPAHIDFIASQIKEYVQNNPSALATKLVISGAADTGLLIAIINALDKNHHKIEFIVIDRCLTVLKQHELLIQYFKFNHVQLVHQDILKNSISDVDIVIAHSFLNFFTPPQQIKLFKKWHEMLKPDGIVIIHQKTIDNSTKIDKKIDKPKIQKSILKLLNSAKKFGFTEKMAHSIQKFWVNQPIMKSITSNQLSCLIEKTGFSIKQQTSTMMNVNNGPLAIRYQKSNRTTQLLVLKK